MNRIASILILILMFASKEGMCDFSLQVDGVGIKKIVATNGKVLVTDGYKLVLLTEQGERISTSQLSLDNSYLLQSAIYNQGYYLLYQHSSGAVDFTIVALSENLETLWQKSYSNQGSSFGYAMTGRNEGGVVVTGRSCSNGFFLYAINSNGDEAWKKLYLQGNASAMPGAIVKNENGYAVAFRFSAGNSYNLGMMTCDNVGNVLQSSIADMSTDFFIKGMTADGVSGFGVLLNRPTVSANTVVEFNSSLQAIHRYEFTTAATMQLTSIVRDNDEYYLSGNVLIPNTNNLDFFYAQYDATSNSAEAYSSGISTGYDDAKDLQVLNGNIWIGGMLSGNGKLMNISNNIQSCSSTQMLMSVQSENISSTSYNLIATSMSAIVIQEATLTSIQNQIIVSLTCGVVTTSSDEDIIEHSSNSNSVNLYPNPASHQFYLDLSSKELTSLTIYNVTGQQVYHQAVLYGVNKIDVSQLTAGAYLTVITDQNNKLKQIKRLILQ